jgi:hypothetical protein
VVLATPLAAQKDPASLPARDQHQGLLVAADPCAEAACSKQLFGKKHPQEAGLLAVEVVFRNDNDQAIEVAVERIRLVVEPPGGERQRVAPLVVEEVVDRIVNKEKKGPSIGPKAPLPIPRRSSGGRGKDWEAVEKAIVAEALEMDVLPPGSTVRGYLFFDLGGRFDLLAHARLYLPELKFVASGESLLFFEVDLGAARR